MEEQTSILPPPEGVSDEAFLLAYLEAHEASCPACGYNVHRLREPRCPECGIAVVLRVVTLERISKSWVAMMITASAAAGIGALIAIAIAVRGWPSYGSPWDEFVRSVTFTYFMCSIPLPLLLLLGRKIIGRLRRGIRVSLAAFSMLVTTTAFILLTRHS